MLLAAAAEAHDRTTGKHLHNVRVISERLALELGYSEEDAREIGLAAVLHDMGKIRVPDSVLANKGRLSGEEWDLMKNHAAWGEQFLAGRSGFDLAATIARYHHERWDGRGYPDGVPGENIPEAAAIVSVADSFDAMTSDRPYKPGPVACRSYPRDRELLRQSVQPQSRRRDGPIVQSPEAATSFARPSGLRRRTGRRLACRRLRPPPTLHITQGRIMMRPSAVTRYSGCARPPYAFEAARAAPQSGPCSP